MCPGGSAVGATVAVFTVVGYLVVFMVLCGSSLAAQGRQVAERLVSVQKDRSHGEREDRSDDPQREA